MDVREMLNRLKETAHDCGFDVIEDQYEPGDAQDDTVFGYLLWFQKVEEPETVSTATRRLPW